MNDLLSRVTPQTLGIIWFPKDDVDSFNPYYGPIDYLLDGLLTAHLETSPELSSRIIIGENFGRSFYVMVVKKIVATEIEGLQTLIAQKLQVESDILVIDETGQFDKIEKAAFKIKSHLRLYK
ncbi:MAG TPA: hypothetical protein VNJ01_06230 [Bacteriovoracaceae bacterium]|nr:hypothetical protein [Bacteriovoracaceae bacterium]